MIVLLTLSILFFLMGLFLSIFLFLHRDCSANSLETDICKNPQFALLIPARDESNVIDGLLQSILNQTRSVIMDDVFVIVESKNDPTISICKKYGASVIVRKRLELRSKGYALMEAIEYLDQKKKRDKKQKKKHHDPNGVTSFTSVYMYTCMCICVLCVCVCA